MKLLICSIHSRIHHQLYPNTEKDMDQTVSMLLHVLTVAHQPIIISITPRNNIHMMMRANTCVQSEEDYALLLYPLMYWSWFVSRYQEAYKRRRRYHHTTLRMSSSTHHHHYLLLVSYKHMDTNKVEPNSFERFNFDQISLYCVNSYV